MVHGQVIDAEAYEYDVQLTARPDDSLRELYPGMTVRSTEAQTALRRRVDGPEELAALLVEISAVGLTLTDVHRVTGTDAGSACPAGPGTYEVRVVGELGGALVRYLGCAHYPVPSQTSVRVTLRAGELDGFLRACADHGARLERVRRVGAACSPAPASRGRATGPGAPRRPGG